ncbi:MAG: fatty acid desaturase [Nannocystaceae bacterium]|nr:fatty acid desaturase [bacterium]
MAITANAAARDVLSRITEDPRLRALEALPVIPPVNLGLALGVWAVFLGSSAAYLQGWLPLPVTIVLSAIAIYASFTPLHDATHRAVSSNAFVNDLIGTISATLLIPCLSTGVYRLLHLEHHRWAGDVERDPDTPLVHTRWPWLPFALAAPELVWAWWWIRKLWPQRTANERLAFFVSLGAHIALTVGMLLSPYRWEFVLLYMIPQKLGIMLVAYSFAHIQHPEGVDWKKAPLLSTGVITTKPRGLMTWLMLGQNDHHIHHLIPHIPWHRYRHVWELGDRVLDEQTLAERGFFRGYDEATVARARVCLDARVQTIRDVARDVRAITFAPAPGTHFPAFEAGAHVDVHLPSGLVRQYSLCNSPTDPDSYEIAVKLDTHGRGGSAEVHAALREGTRLTLGAPRNLFRLDPAASEVVLAAGGIGVTPLLSMSHALHESGAAFRLHIYARSSADVPFGAELDTLAFAEKISTHLDSEGQPGFDADRDVGPYREGRQLYLCGPAGFMNAVRAAATALGWPESAVHSESFGADVSGAAENRPFELELRRSKVRLPVAADETILDALRTRGIEVPTACLQGVCGRCVTPVLEGEVEHRDAVLTPAQRCEQMCLCVSRAREQRLVLDL